MVSGAMVTQSSAVVLVLFWGGKVVVVGLHELHLLWYGLEHGSDPPSPLWYHRLVVGVENGHRFFCRRKPVVFGFQAVWVTDVAPVSVHAREV